MPNIKMNWIPVVAAASPGCIASASARNVGRSSTRWPRVGLTFTYENGSIGQFYVAEVMGAGAALVDIDRDGDLDVFLLQGQSFDLKAPRDAARTHRLFRNELVERGTLRFTDVTVGSGLDAPCAMGVAAGDYDNDGDQDLYVTALGPNTLYRNNDGTFTDVTAAAGVADERWSTAATFLDYDRDGDLDLFVANYLDFSPTNNKQCFNPVGARDYCGPRSYHPVPDRLFRNEGAGRFMDVTEAAGITKADGAGLGVATGDYNGAGGSTCRRQRRDAEPALDQPEERHVRRRRRAGGRGVERRR